MKRTNKFRLRPTEEQEKILFNLCEMSAVLWNKLNYIRRQAFFDGRFNWNEGVKELYDEFKRILGSATAQQIIRKNDEAWRSFFALSRLKRQGNHKNGKVNAMIHNFWRFRYIIERLITTAENFGIEVKLVKEDNTSSICPFCGTKGKRVTRGLVYCPECNKVMNADVVGCLNIAKKCKAIIPSPSWRGRDNGVLTHPVVSVSEDYKPPRKESSCFRAGRMSIKFAFNFVYFPFVKMLL